MLCKLTIIQIYMLWYEELNKIFINISSQNKCASNCFYTHLFRQCSVSEKFDLIRAVSEGGSRGVGKTELT